MKSTTYPRRNLSIIFPMAPPIINEREISSSLQVIDVLKKIYNTVISAATESIVIKTGIIWFSLFEKSPQITPVFLM